MFDSHTYISMLQNTTKRCLDSQCSSPVWMQSWYFQKQLQTPDLKMCNIFAGMFFFLNGSLPLVPVVASLPEEFPQMPESKMNLDSSFKLTNQSLRNGSKWWIRVENFHGLISWRPVALDLLSKFTLYCSIKDKSGSILCHFTSVSWTLLLDSCLLVWHKFKFARGKKGFIYEL